MEKIHFCEISDSWVHPENKLSNGKKGHGESRLFVSCSKEIVEKICSKPWKINFDDNYKKDIKTFMEDNDNFIKKHNHYVRTVNNILMCDNMLINIELQQGNMDVRRNYVGVKNLTNEDKKNWKLFRKSVAPTITTIEFYDNEEYINLKIIHNKNVKKYNVPHGCSFISLEWLKYMENIYNIEIQHAMNGGEHKERKNNGYFAGVDGYHECGKHICCGTKENPCEWNKTVFEFQGDYWHRNKQEKDKEKKDKYESLGYKVVVMWEHEFVKIKKSMKNY